MTKQKPATTAKAVLAISKQEKLKDAMGFLFEQQGLSLESTDADRGVLRDRSNDLKPIEVEFARARDALLLLQRGVVNAAILGSDIVEEYQASRNGEKTAISLRKTFDVAACRMCVAAPAKQVEKFRKDPQAMNGLRFATSYPATLERWLAQRNITAAEIVTLDGGVESAIRRGLADVVMDIVQTGASLRRNGLEIVETVKKSSACLYTIGDKEMATPLTKLSFRMAEKNAGNGIQGIH